MIVSHILQSHTERRILTVKQNDSVGDAAKILSENRIGAVIVSGDGSSVDGILSERDIVRELGVRGGVCLTDKVADLMTANVQTCAKGDTIVSVMQRMTEGRFRHLPVIEDGALIGVVSIGDIVKARMEEMSHENTALTDMIAGNA